VKAGSPFLVSFVGFRIWLFLFFSLCFRFSVFGIWFSQFGFGFLVFGVQSSGLVVSFVFPLYYMYYY
jgi:hypothetical protein